MATDDRIDLAPQASARPRPGPGHCALCTSQLGSPAFPYENRWDGTDYCFRRCQACATVSLDPMPDPAQQEQIFRYADYHAVHYASVAKAKHDRAIRALARHAPANCRLLDFGCGSGAFLRAARLAGYDCEGVEYEATAIAEAQTFSGVRVQTREAALAAGARFDVVRLGYVLTSLARPEEALRSLKTLIAPGGLLLVENAVENNPSVAYWLTASGKAVRRAVGQNSRRVWAPTILWRTDAATLRRFLARTGYGERHFELFDEGWPLYDAQHPLKGPGPLIKRNAARLAVRLSQRPRIGRYLGNQCLLLLEPATGTGGPVSR